MTIFVPYETLCCRSGMKRSMKWSNLKVVLLVLLLLAVDTACGTQLVEGVIYLKDGSTVELVGSDRIRLPGRHGSLKVLRNAFGRHKCREKYAFGDIDSVVCWHGQSPEITRKFLPAYSPGWMWVYFETPNIRVCVYSGRGYGIAANGGIQVWQKHRFLSQSRVSFFVQKRGEERFYDMGGANRRSKDLFRERLARYVEDDPELAERIRRSSAMRSKTVLLLADYDPVK